MFGVLFLNVGEQTKLPPKDRVLEEGFAYTKAEARDCLHAFIRKRFRAQEGKARRRAVAKS